MGQFCFPSVSPIFFIQRELVIVNFIIQLVNMEYSEGIVQWIRWGNSIIVYKRDACIQSDTNRMLYGNSIWVEGWEWMLTGPKSEQCQSPESLFSIRLLALLCSARYDRKLGGWKLNFHLPHLPTGLQLDSAQGRQHEIMEGERGEKSHFPSPIIGNIFDSKSSIYSTTVTALMEIAALVEETRVSRNLQQTWNRWP